MPTHIANPNDILPDLLIAAIRGGAWTSPNADGLRRLARVVSRAQHAALPTDELLVALGAQAQNDMPFPSADWSAEMHAVSDLIWPMLASPMGTKTRLCADGVRFLTVAESIEAAQSFVAEETAKRAMPSDEADRIVRAEMERVSALYPELGMSYGYIGNIWWSPRRDDRSFMVFTNMRDDTGRSVSFGSHGHDQLGELARMAKANLETWAATQSARLRGGEIRHVSNMALAA